MPQPSQAATGPAASGWAATISPALTALVATPSARLPRLRYQAVDSAQASQAALSPATSSRASSTPMASTISGMPRKWLAMLRGSRW